MERNGSVTELLHAWGAGDDQARDDLVPLVYRELRRRAAAFLRRERAAQTLQPTALVHEAYTRLVGGRPVAWESRGHFFAIASRVMRRVLVEYAREHGAVKRGAGALRVSLHDGVEAVRPRDCDLVVLDLALQELEQQDARQARIVELRYFAGLTEHEVAAVLGLSRATVTREWRGARAWLFRRMTTGRGAA